MPERESYAHGTPSWIDLSTTDPEGAQAFYGSLFGWTFDPQPTDQGGEYIMAVKGDRAAAGMMQQQPQLAEMGLPSMWSTYVTVTDVDSAVALVEPAGGQVLMAPMQVMDSGRMAVIADPTGAAISLWQPEGHIGAEVVDEHGALTWNECQSPDMATAAKFYADVFGWGTDEMDMGPEGSYTVFTLGAEGIAGCMTPPMDDVPPNWAVVFAIDDTDAAVETARAAGGTIIVEPFDIPFGRQAVLADPQGAVFSIINLADQPDG